MLAFPWDTAPECVLRDPYRDRIYGEAFRTQAANMAICEVLTAPRSPRQSPYIERLIGSIRRECLDHVIVMDQGPLRRQIASYLEYCHGSRSHLSLGKDTPDKRAVGSLPYPRSGAFIIDTSKGLPNPRAPGNEFHCISPRA